MLRKRNATAYMVVNFWLGQEHDDLADRLTVTLDTISAWAFDDTAPEVVLEELHTAATLLLMRRLGLRRAPAFSELVEREVAAGGLNQGLWFADYSSFDDAPTMGDLLLDLKTVRARSKHQGSRESREWLDRNFWGSIVTLEYLAECVRDGLPRRSPALTSESLAQLRASHAALYAEEA
ncbi:hypothetical protein [Micromonospora sp. NPDC048063]|uniref:hypothetical protein n=1 Tax=Micromonospora sp. NPDC048063 TaxID=3364256 RepID=UPI00371AEA27